MNPNYEFFWYDIDGTGVNSDGEEYGIAAAFLARSEHDARVQFFNRFLNAGIDRIRRVSASPCEGSSVEV